MESRFGINILSYNNWEQTIKCLDSIISTNNSNCKIVIIDNCSTDNSYNELNKMISTYQKYKDVALISSGRNGGFSFGNNIGATLLKEKYKCEKIIIVNNDVVFHAGAIEKLFNSLDYDKRCLLVVPKVIDETGKEITPPTKRKRNFLQIFGLAPEKNRIINWNEIDSISKIYSFSGCCLAVNTALFSKIGMFDENVFLYNEENIISAKAEKAGLSIYAEPNAIITHFQGKSTGRSNMFTDKEYVKSSLYYFKEYENKDTVFLWLFRSFMEVKVLLKICMKKYSKRFSYKLFCNEVRTYYKYVIDKAGK